MSDSSVTPAVVNGRAASAIASTVAAIEGAALVFNGLAVAVVVLRNGVTGPSPVASPAGVAVEVLLYLLFGGALLWVARGVLRGRQAVLTPFVLAQLLGLTVAVPLARGEGVASLIGWAASGLCLLGIAAWWVLFRRRVDQ